jgi:hypothetical protein
MQLSSNVYKILFGKPEVRKPFRSSMTLKPDPDMSIRVWDVFMWLGTDSNEELF